MCSSIVITFSSTRNRWIRLLPSKTSKISEFVKYFWRSCFICPKICSTLKIKFGIRWWLFPMAFISCNNDLNLYLSSVSWYSLTSLKKIKNIKTFSFKNIYISTFWEHNKLHLKNSKMESSNFSFTLSLENIQRISFSRYDKDFTFIDKKRVVLLQTLFLQRLWTIIIKMKA